MGGIEQILFQQIYRVPEVGLDTLRLPDHLMPADLPIENAVKNFFDEAWELNGSDLQKLGGDLPNTRAFVTRVSPRSMLRLVFAQSTFPVHELQPDVEVRAIGWRSKDIVYTTGETVNTLYLHSGLQLLPYLTHAIDERAASSGRALRPADLDTPRIDWRLDSQSPIEGFNGNATMHTRAGVNAALAKVMKFVPTPVMQH